MVRRLKEDIREVAGRVSQADRRADRHRRPAGRRPRAAALAPARRVPRPPRGALRRTTSKRKQAAAGLLVSGLQQRLLSSIEAFARTLRVHRRTVQRQWEKRRGSQPEPEPPSMPDLFAPGVDNDDDRAPSRKRNCQAEEDAQIEAATTATAGSMADQLRRSSAASSDCSTR